MYACIWMEYIERENNLWFSAYSCEYKMEWRRDKNEKKKIVTELKAFFFEQSEKSEQEINAIEVHTTNREIPKSWIENNFEV